MGFSIREFRANRGGSTAPDGQSRPDGGTRWPSLPFKLFHKLALIIGLSGLPALLLGYLFVAELGKDTLSAAKERSGLAYLVEAWGVLAASLTGQDPAGPLMHLAAAGDGYDGELRTASYRAALDAAARQRGPTAVAASRDFIQRVADNSGLSVDSDLSTLQAITIFTARIPDVAAAGAIAVVSLQAAGDRDAGELLGLFQRLVRQLNANLGVTDALNFEPELALRVGRDQAAFTAAEAALIDAAVNRPADREALAVRHLEFQSALSRFWYTGVGALDRLMATRLDYLHAQMIKNLWTAGAVVALLTALIWLVSLSITGRLSGLGRAMESMRRGRLDIDVPLVRKRDEIGAMARAVEDFRLGLIAKRKVDEALIRNQQDLERQNLCFDAALSNMSQGLAMFDAETRLIVANNRFAEVYGISGGHLAPGVLYRDLISEMLAEKVFSAATAEAIRAGTHPFAMSGIVSDSFVELRDGRVLFVARRTMPDGGWVSTHEDITERRRAEAKMAYMAQHDALTDLPNRLQFRERLEEIASRAQPDKWAAVFCLDLDNFKSVNDTLGHPVGDLLLKAVADRLRATLAEPAIIARLSGDEFAIVEPQIEDSDRAGAIAQQLIAAIALPFDIEGHKLVISTSVGIAIAPSDGARADQLLKNADMALYRAKSDGRGTHRFFEREMDARLQERRALELDIRQALAEGGFELHYQAQVNLARDTVSGFEGLIRWQHPVRGAVAPADFIPLAEETGLIIPIGEWVIRTACTDAARWPSDIRVAVNLSPVQFRSNLVATVMNALALSGLPPSRLELEITESVLLDNTEATLATLHQLRALGVHISMDDFGTGYSSLSYLRSFPFDKIKIDRSFTRDLETTADSAAIVRAVASLGTSLGITTTAEGVETARQLEMVRGEGCTEVQGYVYSKAIPADAVWELLARFQNSTARVA